MNYGETHTTLIKIVNERSNPIMIGDLQGADFEEGCKTQEVSPNGSGLCSIKFSSVGPSWIIVPVSTVGGNVAFVFISRTPWFKMVIGIASRERYEQLRSQNFPISTEEDVTDELEYETKAVEPLLLGGSKEELVKLGLRIGLSCSPEIKGVCLVKGNLGKNEATHSNGVCCITSRMFILTVE
jgi:hypothetical protein